MTIDAGGYIVARESAIIGAGDTLLEAATQALEWLDDYDTPEALIQGLEQNAGDAQQKDARPWLHRASARLIESVEKGGTPEQWTLVDDIACTAEEAAALNR